MSERSSVMPRQTGACVWSSFVPFQLTFSLRSAWRFLGGIPLAGSLRDLDADGYLYRHVDTHDKL